MFGALRNQFINKLRKHPLNNKRLFIYQCDASNEYDVLNFFDQVKKKTKKIDALINNVGVAGPTGTIEKIGKGVNKYKVGDLISIGADIPCGKCEHCLNGRSNCCDINYAIGYQFDGGFSQFMLLDPLIVKYGPLQKVNKTVNPDIAALAEPLACCINGYERGLVNPGSTIVVFGGGPIGLLLCMLAPIYKAKKVILIEPTEDRINFAKNNIEIIDDFINPNECNPVDEIMKLTNGVGANLIFTANPVAKTHELALEIVSKRGVVNFLVDCQKLQKK